MGFGALAPTPPSTVVVLQHHMSRTATLGLGA
jgi:hypothetical protein